MEKIYVKDYNVEEFTLLFKDYYDKMYDGKIDEQVQDELTRLGDMLICNRKHIVKGRVDYFNHFRADYLTSDREVAAFAATWIDTFCNTNQ